MKALVFTKRFVTCPTCGKSDHVIEHLFEGFGKPGYGESLRAGPWPCQVCGHSFNLTCWTDGTVELEPSNEPVSVPITVLLEIPPQNESIFLKVAAETYGRPVTDDKERYFYEEHTCPVNYLRSVVEVKVGDDEDPHGLALYRSWYVAEDAQRSRELIGHAGEYNKQHNLLPAKKETTE